MASSRAHTPAKATDVVAKFLLLIRRRVTNIRPAEYGGVSHIGKGKGKGKGTYTCFSAFS